MRDLRMRKSLTQQQLAKILGGSNGLSSASVSLWETPRSNRMPPLQRLAAYARLFCSSRSFASREPRLLGDDELTEEERENEAVLYEELLTLRNQTQFTNVQAVLRHRNTFWHFPDGRAVSIVCADLPEPPPYAVPGHPNYSPYASVL